MAEILFPDFCPYSTMPFARKTPKFLWIVADTRVTVYLHAHLVLMVFVLPYIMEWLYCKKKKGVLCNLLCINIDVIFFFVLDNKHFLCYMCWVFYDFFFNVIYFSTLLFCCGKPNFHFRSEEHTSWFCGNWFCLYNFCSYIGSSLPSIIVQDENTQHSVNYATLYIRDKQDPHY